MSSATVSRVINFLKKKNLVVLNDKGITDCGRRPEIYSRRAAGEIGDMFFDQMNYEAEYCDNMGCLESHAGIQILFNRMIEAMKKGCARILKQLLQEAGKEKPDLETIEQVIIVQDYDVSEIFDEIIKIWSSAIINIISVIAPKILVIGGAVGSQNQTTLNKILCYTSKGLCRIPDIRLSSLGFQAQVYGGIYLLKEFVYNRIIIKIIIEQS